MENKICGCCFYWMEIGMGWGVCQCHNDNKTSDEDSCEYYEEEEK